MMLTAVMGILASFTPTPVQPYTAGGNNNTAGGNNNTAGGNNNTAGGNNNTAGGNNNTAGGNNNTAGVIGVSINEIGPLDIQNDRPFTDTATILNLLNLKSIMGCPGGLAQYLVRISGKKRTSLYISREKGVHYYIQTRHNDLFSHYNLFLGKFKEKLTRKAPVYILSEYVGSCSCPLGIP